MRKILLVSAFAFSAFALQGISPSQAATGAWCANTQSTMVDNCAFQTRAQCQAFVSGQAGTCDRNVIGVRNAQARMTAPARSWNMSATDAYLWNSNRP